EVDTTKTNRVARPQVIGIHERRDLALFRVAARAAPGGRRPQPLPVARRITIRPGRRVYVVGYPASDSRRNEPEALRRLFADIYNVKRLLPGEVRSVLPRQWQLLHDCSTLGGNSGSCVVDLETHHVIGLHFGGRYLEVNKAVALWRLTGDALLTKAKVNFV